jgi:predicted RND superfamily exporter protein
MMWERIARFVLRFRWILLGILALSTTYMAYQASGVQLSYEISRVIPPDHPKFLAYQAFRRKFGEDGNLLVIGIQTDHMFSQEVFNAYAQLSRDLKAVPGVEEVLSVPFAINLVKKDSSQLLPQRIFPDGKLSQALIDQGEKIFVNLPFYRGLLYNPETHAYLVAININRNIMNSPARTQAVSTITRAGDAFASASGIEVHYSGLPMIRTHLGTKVAAELKWFLLSSVLLMTLILLLFFRSIGSMALSLSVVIIGVIWSIGTIRLLDYRITLLTVLIPSLIIVIGIPNCIYFLNKFHTAYTEKGDKQAALVEMIRKMGIVTLFCNLSAGIGFGVFALTKSAVLKEFGVVAGINIMMLFAISFILIPAVLSFLPPPKEKHTRYLENKWLGAILGKLELWTLNNKGLIYGTSVLILGLSIWGISKIRSEGFIADDLPRRDPIYRDLSFLESNFKGVMPLEIVVDTRRKRGLSGAAALKTFDRIDQLSRYIGAKPEMAKPLSLVEGLKFIRQAYYNGDSTDYALPNQFDILFLAPFINMKSTDSSDKNNLVKLINSFIDSNKQQTRISVNMADVGTKRLPPILEDIRRKSAELFDSAHYTVTLTGSSVTFLAGSDFIIRGLKQSIAWAFVLIACCMLYLFRSLRILLCSLIPNMIPLIITAGVMGWTGVPLKPSTVLVFSVALGIAIDITIRFLVNYKQELKNRKLSPGQAVIQTIHSTGISIIYTSLVLIAGFGIFCFSDFGGTRALGWLTSLTLVMATLTNLIFLPALLMTLNRSRGPAVKAQTSAT